MSQLRIGIGCLLALSSALSACGKIGYLEQPAPLYGAKAKADWKARQAAQQAAPAQGAEAPLPEELTPPEPGSATPTPAAPPQDPAAPQ
jgi:hypothetical protein